MADTKDYLTIYRRFFEEFATTVNPDDQLPVKVAGYYLCDSELVGEIVDWTLQYLNQKRCPSSLVAPITRIVVDEIKHACRKQPAACGYRTADNTYQPLKLMQVVTGKVNEVCLRYRDNGNLATLPPPSPGPPISSCAIKNTRRRMEDRHVIIEDFHAVFNIQDWSPTSYYAVFDGHAGTDAAVYSVSHLHQFLAESSFYPTDPERALKDAFSRTDALFLEKSNRENLRSGTTAVCALLRPKEKMLYVAWLGDSQAVLVRNGQAVRVVNPHKPDRQDERERIEVMGGCVLYWGTWRVNGQLAVSRAIGDPEYKPYVTAEPDVTAVPLNGAEDFLVLACDGLWDFVTEQEAIEAVYQQLSEAPGDLEAVSQRLVQLSKEQGSTDNISVIVVFLREPAQLAMDSNAGLLYKQNGTAAPSATDLYFLNRQDDDDDDLGPETDVDAVDDVLLSPAIAASKAAALSNNNPFSLEADLELQRQQLKDFDPESEPRHDTPTPPADQVAGEPGVAALVPESDNVAESGEDSEDEWNYYRVEPSADESQQSTQPICEKSVQLQLEDESNMESQLNPDAAEFVPSPTQLMPSMEEVLLAQSPRKGVPMEDISVPSQIEFQHEVSQRPSELEVTDKLPDLISSGLDDTTNPFVHNGGSYSDFLEDVERAQKSVLDESESSSTKAEFGDDSTVSFLTTGSELQKTVTESVSSLSAVEKSLAEQDLLGAEFTSGVSKSNNGSTCDENELSEFNESEMLVSKSVEENVLHKDSTVFINTEGTIPVCFELQKELIPEMELQPERVQLESEGTSSFEQDESGSPVGKKSEEPALSFQEKSAVNQLFSEDVPLVGLGTATSTPERAPMEQELLLSPEEDEEIKLCPDAAGTLSPDLNEASLLQQCPEPTAASKASLLDFSVSHKVNLEPFTCEKLADNIEVMGGKKEGPTFDMLTDECTMKEQEMSVTQTPPPTPAHMSDEEPIRIPPLSSPSLPSPTQLSIYEQIHPQTEASLAQQISPSTLIPLPEQASAPILASVSEEAPLPTLIPASEKALSPTLAPAFEEDPLLFLAPASEEAPLPTLAPASEEAPLPTLAPASEEAPLPTLAPASEEAPLPTLAPASEEALSSTLPPEPEETALLTLAHATEEALLPTLSPAPEETALLTLALASEETLLPTLLPASKEALSPTLAPAFEEISSATLAPVSEEIPPLAPVSEEIPTLAPVSEQLPSLAPLSEQIPSLASFSEQTPLPTFASASESVPSSTPVSEPAATCTSASEGLMKAPSDSAVLAAAVLAPVAIVPAVKAVSSEKKTSAKKPAPAKDKKVPVTAEKPKTASQKATAVTKTVQKSTPTSPTKPASSTIRSSTPKKPSSAAAAAASKPPTKSSPLTSKPGVSPSKPPASKTVASPRPRPAATGTAKPGSLSNGDVAKSAATKKPAATATRPPARPTTAPAGPKQVSSSVASRTTAVLATAQRPKPGAVNGTAAKTRATGTVATAAARNKVAAARDTKLATDKQVKETANKHILSARTTTVTATRRVAGSVTRTTVTATGTVKATTATSKVGSKKTTTSTGVARTTTTTTTKTTKTAASVNNESAVQVAD